MRPPGPRARADFLLSSDHRAKARSPASVKGPSAVLPVFAQRMMCSATNLQSSWSSPFGRFLQTRSSATFILANVRESKPSSIIITPKLICRSYDATYSGYRGGFLPRSDLVHNERRFWRFLLLESICRTPERDLPAAFSIARMLIAGGGSRLEAAMSR